VTRDIQSETNEAEIEALVAEAVKEDKEEEEEP
jgi:hypothetical protein